MHFCFPCRSFTFSAPRSSALIFFFFTLWSFHTCGWSHYRCHFYGDVTNVIVLFYSQAVRVCVHTHTRSRTHRNSSSFWAKNQNNAFDLKPWMKTSGNLLVSYEMIEDVKKSSGLDCLNTNTVKTTTDSKHCQCYDTVYFYQHTVPHKTC